MRRTLSPPRSLWLDLGRLRGDFPDSFSHFSFADMGGASDTYIACSPLWRKRDEATALRGQLEALWVADRAVHPYPSLLSSPLLLW